MQAAFRNLRFCWRAEVILMSCASILNRNLDREQRQLGLYPRSFASWSGRALRSPLRRSSLPDANRSHRRGAIGPFFPAFLAWMRTRRRSAAIELTRVAPGPALAVDRNAKRDSICNDGSHQSGLRRNCGAEEHSGKQDQCRTEQVHVLLETSCQNTVAR